MGPANIAQLVRFLATDEAADINGQVFVVFGGNIWAMGGFHPVGEVHRDHDVDTQELVGEQGRALQGDLVGRARLRHRLTGSAWLTWLARPTRFGAG